MVSVGWSGARARRLDAGVWPALAELQDLLPGIINQLGPDNLANLKKLAETYQGGGAHHVLQTSGHCMGPRLSTQPFPRTSALRPSRGLRAHQRAHHTLGAAPPDPCSVRSNVKLLSTGNPPPGANADDDDDEDVPDLVDNFEEASK